MHNSIQLLISDFVEYSDCEGISGFIFFFSFEFFKNKTGHGLTKRASCTDEMHFNPFQNDKF